MTLQSTSATPEDGLNFACILDGAGGARALDWAGVRAWKAGDGHLWAHLDRSAPAAVEWLEAQSTIPEDARAALLAAETRPRAFTADAGMVVILRGINQNTGSEADDMVAIRIWIEPGRIISLRHRRLMTPRAIYADLIEKGGGPKSAAAVLIRLADKLTEQMNAVVIGLDEQLDAIEARMEERNLAPLRSELADIRQSCVILRRYLGPQREALAVLQTDRPAWMEKEVDRSLRETSDRLLRYLEELDATRDRAVVIRDEIANRLSEDMNRTMYALSIVAGIFLPLGLLTGLLGINVGGMPGVESGSAFWVICILLVVIVAGELWLFRRMKWI